MKTIRKQLILAISMVFLVLAVCSAAAAADVSDNGIAIQAQNQTAAQLTSHNSTNLNSIQVSETNSSQTSTTNPNSVQNTTKQPSKVVISGQVKKCSSGEPFAGATVTAEKDGIELASTTTKEDGTYSLEFPSNDNVFTVTASYPGHESSSKEVTVNHDSNGTLRGTADFQLGMDDVYVSPTGSDITGDGTQGNPYQTIGKGINEVNAGGTLHLADGIYNQPNDRGLTITQDVTIVGESQAGTIIDAQGADRIFTINPGVTVTIQDLTLENGNSGIRNGGAISNSGDLTVTDCTFTGNTASFGGAIFTSNGSTLTVDGNTFTGNHAFIGGAIINDGTLNVNGSTFTGNTAFYGGAVFNEGTLNVTGSNFENNSAGFDGGAIFNSGGDATNRKFNFNRIVGNSPANSEVHSEGGTLDARFNWWGSNLSPAGKISTAFGGVVLFDPWLVLTITANPTTIINGDTSQITADLLHDSNGVFHDPAFGHVPDGIPITLTTDWGSFTNPGITHSITLGTVNGSVTATFFANEGPTPQPPLNPVEITATADDQNVSTFITILPPPPQRQTQNQTQTSNNINTNNLTNNNSNALLNVNTFNPVISLVNLNGAGVN